MDHDRTRGSGVALVAGHLCAPYATRITPHDVCSVLRGGTLRVPSLSEEKRAILASLFVECQAQLILRATLECGGCRESVVRLYREIVSGGGARIPEIEEMGEAL